MKLNLNLSLLFAMVFLGDNACGQLVSFKKGDGRVVLVELYRGETYANAKMKLADKLEIDFDRIVIINMGRSMKNEAPLDFENAPNMGTLRIRD